MAADLDEYDYLRRLELLARELVNSAHREGWLDSEPGTEGVTPLRRTVDEIARTKPSRS
ncbi:hypothetical protein [Actinomadura violacea]|uniref:Transposase n=1 Tax=Actinomadura violacea TaxID=2819934 RepID=A0ABS3RTR4_9ACTN|nr:hypothetical protein [Actinomadura violacea]MBO2459415.1 hypothetical protein [Actinomadura violacea]